MGDMKEEFQALNQLKKERHEGWYTKNVEIIKQSGIPFKWTSDTCMIFRNIHKPKADFYPHTGRWRSQNKTYSGGAKAFIVWYKKQKINNYEE